MFDTMTMTKTAGALCGALLVFLLGNWAAESIYSMGGGHGEDHAQGYVIDTGEDEASEEAADEGPSIGELMAAADPANGEGLFRNCAACHAVADGENKVGPHLYGVVGRDVGSVASYGSYSGSLTEVAQVWTPVELNAFLENPKSYAPGTTMGYAGMRKAEDRADLIAYLDQTDGTTFEMPAEEAAAEPAAEEAAAEPAAEEAAAEPAAEEAAAEPAADEAAAEPAAEEAAAEPAAEEAAAEPAAEEAAAEPAAEEAAAEPAAEAGASDFAALVAAADVAEGEKLFRRCGACHKLEDGKNGAGPHLFGIVGRDIANVDGFSYSDALKGLDGAWTVDQLSAWIENPRAFAPGNRMGFPGLKDEQDRANLIGYLQSSGN
ncbi:c-type cytochrome [Roseovarius sp. 217]|uniref:c-type cytochrome n=1 Tax=Roseovarius sp. (strain 217) TaxID=314264 RepID=UPI0000684AFA|nr:cytochrome c family protein [Roseovarius sp. 217]EAQ22890.1 Cytochrome cy [Roseovarius sp. 217]